MGLEGNFELGYSTKYDNSPGYVNKETIKSNLQDAMKNVQDITN